MVLPSIFPIACHTDRIGQGSTFVAIQGYTLDGADFIPQAVARGATTIVVDENRSLSDQTHQLLQRHSVHLIKVANTRKVLATLSAEAAGWPANKLRIIGITGTKGKTTSAFVLEHILRTAGYKTALLGTVKNSIMDTHLGTGLTTQQPDYLHQFFKLCVEQQVTFVVMEVAAQALTLNRTDGITFDGILFTNFSQEHGEFYASMDDYFAAKCQIFAQRKLHAPVYINADDPYGARLLHDHPEYLGFGIKTEAAARATLHGDRTTSCKFNMDSNSFACPSLVGTYNIYNLLSATVMAIKLGIDHAVIANALNSFAGVPGRMERHFLPNGAQCIIDYAHTPSSFESVLSTLTALTDHLIVIFGCGGNRDVAKRPLMGGIATHYANLVILTTDNPRSECPAAIIDTIMQGVAYSDRAKVVKLLDRKDAITYAYSRSSSGTIIALLGKGPDEYQIIGTTKTAFSEVAIIRTLS
jgi:UDP-N-acetylmuramoyl-L-alanyl-D-glutamate--2,6-diaminopimelate ligase